ncbi:unnamed protein product [Porites evermanni]|uniref:Uncharacterized protein n=1 Tax=Porites evermanni TaxID=104178 RepID=A0ABN8LG86_9CNID|nr:unnamed protein product [Porites evermanni]
MLQAKQNGCDRALLTQQLRRYSTDHVKIAVEDTEQAKLLQTTKQEVTQEDAGVPGFVLLKASQDSQLRKYANAAGYILPEKLRDSRFFLALFEKL